MNLPKAEEPEMERKWVIYVDGSSTKKNGGAGILLITPDGEELSGSLRLEFRTTNNKAEYEVVIASLGMAFDLGAEFVEIQSDFQVIVGHIIGEFEEKGEKMKRYLTKVQNMQSFFQKFCITKVPREDNEKADHLSRMVSAEITKIKEGRELIRSLSHPSISNQPLVLALIEEVSN
jgi:ribonuclease HI